VIPDLVEGADHVADLVVVAQRQAVMKRDPLGVGSRALGRDKRAGSTPARAAAEVRERRVAGL